MIEVRYELRSDDSDKWPWTIVAWKYEDKKRPIVIRTTHYDTYGEAASHMLRLLKEEERDPGFWDGPEAPQAPYKGDYANFEKDVS